MLEVVDDRKTKADEQKEQKEQDLKSAIQDQEQLFLLVRLAEIDSGIMAVCHEASSPCQPCPFKCLISTTKILSSEGEKPVQRPVMSCSLSVEEMELDNTNLSRRTPIQQTPKLHHLLRCIAMQCIQQFRDVLSGDGPGDADAHSAWHVYTLAQLRSFTRRFLVSIAPIADQIQQQVFTGEEQEMPARDAFRKSLVL